MKVNYISIKLGGKKRKIFLIKKSLSGTLMSHQVPDPNLQGVTGMPSAGPTFDPHGRW